MRRSGILFCCFALILVAAYAYAAGGRIDMSPKRLVIEPRERSGEIAVVNIVTEPGIYRVTLISNRLKPEGGYEKLETPLDPVYNPEEYVRISPRQFTLQPKGIQRIRLSVRRPAELPEGDFRFHVLVSRLSNPEDLNQQPPRQGQLLKLTGHVGMSIPVVIRQSAFTGDVAIESAELVSAAETLNGQPALDVNLRRIGNQDIFGTMQVYWEPAGGQRERIGLMNNLNVFHETDTRSARIQLEKQPQGPGKLIIQYHEDHYKQGVLDEMALQL